MKIKVQPIGALLCLLAFIPAIHAQTTWSGTGSNWLGNATWSAGVPNSSTAAILTGASTLNVDTAATAASVDLANASGTLTLNILNGNSLTVSGAITDSGAGTGNLQVNNTNSGNATTVLSATSIAASTLTLAVPVSTNTTHMSFGNNVTLSVQLAMGTNGNNGNASYVYTQTGGTLNLTSTSNYGLSIGQGASTANGTGTNTFNLNGGTVLAQRIGVMNADGNNSGTARYSMNGVLNFNSGTIQNLNTSTSLLIQNGLANTGSTANSIQFETSKPLNVVLGTSGTREFQANTQSIFVSPSAQLTGTGGFTKTGNGTMVLTGGGPVAVNSWSGDTVVNAGTLSADYGQIAGQAASGGTDSLSGAYSATSRLILNGGNFTLAGRSSASGSTANVTAQSSGTSVTLTLASTSGLVVGQSVSGTNVPAGAYIRRILSGTQIEISHQSTGSVSLVGTQLTFGAASFANTQTINNVTLNATNSTITVNPGSGTSTTLLTMGNVTGSGGFTKAGTGRLQLTGTLDYTGGTAVSAGTLEFAPASGTSTLTGNVTGSGAILKTGSGTTVIANGAGNNNSFTGSIQVDGGTLRLGQSANGSRGLTSATSLTINNGGTVEFLRDAINASAVVTVNNGGLLTAGTGGSFTVFNNLTLNGGTFRTGQGLSSTFQSAALNGNVTVSGSSASVIDTAGGSNSGLHLAANTANVTRGFNVANVTGNSAPDLTVSAVLTNSSNNATFTSGLEKLGAGTMVLSAANSYTGNTTVTAGTLIINGSLNAASSVFVASGAVLGGNGTINGALSITGIMAPGNSIGTLNAGSTVWNGASSALTATDWQFELGAANAADLLNIAGDFTKNTSAGSVFRFDFLGNTELGTFKLVDWSGTTNFLVNDFSYTGLGGDRTGTFAFNGSQLEFTVVPEPSTWALLAGSLGVAMILRRRSRTR